MVVELILLAWFWHNRKIKISQTMAVIAFTGFLGIVLASTVLTREVEVRQYKLIPLWSWKEVIVHNDMKLLQEILLNCILLMPAGGLDVQACFMEYDENQYIYDCQLQEIQPDNDICIMLIIGYSYAFSVNEVCFNEKFVRKPCRIAWRRTSKSDGFKIRI